jgi:hypothetical protein
VKNPAAIRELATRALAEGKVPAAYFLDRLRNGKASDPVGAFLTEHGGRWPTGWSWVRAAASGTFKQDPLGYDVPTYDVPGERPTRAEIAEALGKKAAPSSAPVPSSSSMPSFPLAGAAVGRSR